MFCSLGRLKRPMNVEKLSWQRCWLMHWLSQVKRREYRVFTRSSLLSDAPLGPRKTVHSSFLTNFILYERAWSRVYGCTPKKSDTISSTSKLHTTVAPPFLCQSIINSRLPRWRIAVMSWHIWATWHFDKPMFFSASLSWLNWLASSLWRLGCSLHLFLSSDMWSCPSGADAASFLAKHQWQDNKKCESYIHQMVHQTHSDEPSIMVWLNTLLFLHFGISALTLTYYDAQYWHNASCKLCEPLRSCALNAQFLLSLYCSQCLYLVILRRGSNDH